MSDFEIEKFDFNTSSIRDWAQKDDRNTDWPVVYLLSNDTHVYVGETVNGASRLGQHLKNDKKRHFRKVHVVLGKKFNKSACLDLESSLIRWFSGDSKYRKFENRNFGAYDHDYFDRSRYQQDFRDIQDALRRENFFSQSVDEIENSDLFKYSPFKAPNPNQIGVIEGILHTLAQGLDRDSFVVQGGAGTGKTIVAVLLAKFLSDLNTDPDAEQESDFYDSPIARLTSPADRQSLRSIAGERPLKVGLVIPQQALRATISRVVRKSTAMQSVTVLSPWQVGQSQEHFDVLIVDEAHRLKRRSNASSGPLNVKWRTINESLFGADDPTKTQLDWITAKSRSSVLMVDEMQSVLPSDISLVTVRSLIKVAKDQKMFYELKTQMRVKAGEKYIEAIHKWLRGHKTEKIALGPYDFQLFHNLEDMVKAVRKKNEEVGLSRLVAGYAWDWVSNKKGGENKYDINIGRVHIKWNNVTQRDWISSSLDDAAKEVGSIHTVQGYDLNYAGVIIGPELKWDENAEKVVVDAENYRDKKGKENLKQLGIDVTDDDILQNVLNIYSVLLTRGIHGTYLYVCDEPLRRRLIAIGVPFKINK